MNDDHFGLIYSPAALGNKIIRNVAAPDDATVESVSAPLPLYSALLTDDYLDADSQALL